MSGGRGCGVSVGHRRFAAFASSGEHRKPRINVSQRVSVLRARRSLDAYRTTLAAETGITTARLLKAAMKRCADSNSGDGSWRKTVQLAAGQRQERNWCDNSPAAWIWKVSRVIAAPLLYAGNQLSGADFENKLAVDC